MAALAGYRGVAGHSARTSRAVPRAGERGTGRIPASHRERSGGRSEPPTRYKVGAHAKAGDGGTAKWGPLPSSKWHTDASQPRGGILGKISSWWHGG